MLLQWCFAIYLLPVMVMSTALNIDCSTSPEEYFPSDPQPDEWHVIPVQVTTIRRLDRENRYDLDAYAFNNSANPFELNFELYLDLTSFKVRSGRQTLCICIKDTHVPQNFGECKEHSRICINPTSDLPCTGNHGQGVKCESKKVKVKSLAAHDRQSSSSDHRCMLKYEITVNERIAKIGHPPVEVSINHIAPNIDADVPVYEIGLIAFYPKGESSTPEEERCISTLYEPGACKHNDHLFIRKFGSPPKIPTQSTEAAVTLPSIIPITPESTTEAEAEAGVANLGLYIVIGVVVAAFIILLIIVILRCIQGKWFCGIACFGKEESVDEKKTYKRAGRSEMSKMRRPNDKPPPPPEEKPNEINNVEEARNPENEVLQKNDDVKIAENDQNPVQAAPEAAPAAPAEEPKKKPSGEGGKKEEKEKKTEKISKSSSSSEAETKTKGTVSKAPKPAQNPNMLLLTADPRKNCEKQVGVLESKDDEKEKEAPTRSKRKAIIEKNYKEPSQTKSTTQDPGPPLTKGGKAATAVAAGTKKNEAKTGLPKSETDLATDKNDKESRHTKGVSATQGDRVTETVGPTQRTATKTKGVSATQGGHVTVGTTQRTMTTGAAKTSKGVSATQGENYTETVGTTQRTGATMATGAGKTSKGVSATQGDHYTEIVGTTQRTGTMATGAGKTSKGVSATQGDHYTENVGTTQRTGTTMATGAGKTSKGVSATQGDQYTENVGTTQRTGTMVTGAGRTSKGVSATQGDHYTENVGTTQRTGTTMATGAGKTSKGVSATQGDKA